MDEKTKRSESAKKKVTDWPPLWWQFLTFLGGLFVVFDVANHNGGFHRNPSLDKIMPVLAMPVSQIILLLAGICALRHLRKHFVAPSSPRSSWFIVLSVIFLLFAVIAVDEILFFGHHRVGHTGHLTVTYWPTFFTSLLCMGTFGIAIWKVGKNYWRNWPVLLKTILPPMIGIALGAFISVDDFGIYKLFL